MDPAWNICNDMYVIVMTTWGPYIKDLRNINVINLIVDATKDIHQPLGKWGYFPEVSTRRFAPAYHAQ